MLLETNIHAHNYAIQYLYVISSVRWHHLVNVIKMWRCYMHKQALTLYHLSTFLDGKSIQDQIQIPDPEVQSSLTCHVEGHTLLTHCFTQSW